MLILAEVARNYYVIEVKKQNPDHRLFMACRLIVGMAFWMVAPLMAELSTDWFGTSPMRHDQWLGLPFMQAFTFFFLFDWLLNISRGLPYWYLGKSTIDSWQKDHGGAFGWFWWRLMLAAGGYSLFLKGLSAVIEYPGLGVNYLL